MVASYTHSHSRARYAGARTACGFYLSGFAILFAALHIGAEPARSLVRPLERAQARGEVRPGVPHLDPEDPMANAAVLMAALDDVGYPGLSSGLSSGLSASLSLGQKNDGERVAPCTSRPRTFALLIDGRLSRVRFGGRSVCQLQRLKAISMAQPGFDRRGLGEVAAFIVGRRVPGGSDVDVTRVVVPPFSFTRDTLTFVPADLGPLQGGEQLIGTYHTHPEDDIEQGVLSDIDLRYMHTGYVDFHGQVGRLREGAEGLDWLFDIVEPRDGDWNVYAHDWSRLAGLYMKCETTAECPVNNLRLTGSPYYLLTRYYQERDED